KTVNGSTLYNLYRRVQLLAEQPGAELAGPDANFSARSEARNPSLPPTGSTGSNPMVLQVNTGNDLSSILNPPASFTPLTGPWTGTDIVLSNVTSFEVKANWDGNYRKMSPTTTVANDLPNFDYPFDDLPFSPLPSNMGSSQVDAYSRIFDASV